MDESTGEIKRIHVTMEGTFSFGFTATSVDELKRLFNDIQDCTRRFDLIRDEVFRSLPPWPRTQFAISGYPQLSTKSKYREANASAPASIIWGLISNSLRMIMPSPLLVALPSTVRN
jgi:hypothetical protein